MILKIEVPQQYVRKALQEKGFKTHARNLEKCRREIEAQMEHNVQISSESVSIMLEDALIDHLGESLERDKEGQLQRIRDITESIGDYDLKNVSGEKLDDVIGLLEVIRNKLIRQ